MSPGHDIRLLAIDLDGTLLNDAKTVSDQTVLALQNLSEQGVKVVIASARPPRSVRPIYRQLKLDTWQINYNGALIWDEPTQQAVFHRPMDCRLARQIIEVARDMFEEVLVSCEVMDRWYTDRLDNTYTTETGKLFKPDVVAEIDTFCNQPITKVMLLGEPRIILRLEALLGQQFEGKISLVRQEAQLIQIMHPQVSKAAALHKVARHYGLRSRQIMAIGDAPNDVGMLQLAGVAVAMDNAHPLVKDVADWVAPSNNDHGVFAALVKYGLVDSTRLQTVSDYP